jgi:hypothetical protein
MKISLEEGLQQLVAKGRKLSRSRVVNQNDVQPTSIRLKPSTRHYLECQAESMSTSMQSIIHMILDSAAESETNSTLGVLRDIHQRFLTLLQTHDIDFPQAVSVLRHHGFTLSAFADENRLLDLLTEQVLRYLSDTFHVNRGWLSGVENWVAINRTWYKEVFPTAETLLNYSKQGLQPRVIFIRRAGAKFEDKDTEEKEEIGFVVRLSRTTDDGVKFHTFEKWAFEPWNYNKSRNDIQSLIAFCEKAASLYRLSFTGYELSQASLEVLRSGQMLPVKPLKLRTSVWYPDNYISGNKKEYEKLFRILDEPDYLVALS